MTGCLSSVDMHLHILPQGGRRPCLNVEPLLPPGGRKASPLERLRLPAAIDQDHSRAGRVGVGVR